MQLVLRITAVAAAVVAVKKKAHCTSAATRKTLKEFFARFFFDSIRVRESKSDHVLVCTHTNTHTETGKLKKIANKWCGICHSFYFVFIARL